MATNTDNRNARNDVPPVAKLYPLGGLLGDLKDDAKRRNDARLSGTPLGPLSGFPALDERLGGCFEVGLHVVHGSPGTGKTAFCLQAAALCACPALFITCEVLPVELLRRHTARVTGTYLGRFKDGSMTPAAVIEQAHKAVAAAPMLALLDATNAPATGATIIESIETVRRLAEGNPHLLIVMDSVQTWADTLGMTGDEYERINLGIAALRQIAVQENVAILYTSERNRASKDRGGQSSGAGSRKIEYQAETVIGLQADSTDDDGAPIYDLQGETPVKVVFGKNRHGESGSPLHLHFSGRLQRFRSAEGEPSAATGSVDMGANLRYAKRASATNGTGKA